jgi:hypothetical protein
VNDAPVITVTVKHIPLDKEIYDELLEALAELDCAFGGPTAQTANARRWLHYRWLIEQSGQGEDK